MSDIKERTQGPLMANKMQPRTTITDFLQLPPQFFLKSTLDNVDKLC